MTSQIPEAFAWGVATSAHQIEGAPAAGGKGASIWDTFSARPGAIKAGATAKVACNYYELFRSDIALMKELGVQAHRFSISWPRILPEGRGQVAAEGLDFYERVIDAHLEAGIDPWICLYHWDLPQALQDCGGWAERDCIDWFVDYAEIVLSRFADRVEYVIPFNERGIFNILGNAFGAHAPGLKDRQTMVASMHHTNLAHSQTARTLRRNWPHLKVGIVENVCEVRAASEDPRDEEARAIAEAFWVRAVVDPNLRGNYPAEIAEEFEAVSKPDDADLLADEVDFVGINYYCPMTIKSDENSILGFAPTATTDPAAECSDIGWEISPDSFHQMLRNFKSDYGDVPVFISENGIACCEDEHITAPIQDAKRCAYLRGHLKAMERAIGEGVDIRGYFCWTLLDNFEWSAGYEFRFGLVHVDFDTLVRTPKQSFQDYRSIIEHHRNR